MNKRQLGLDPDAVVDSTMFEELVVKYAKIVGRVEDMVVHQARIEVENGLKEYLAR